MSDRHTVFLYGTLKRGFPNHDFGRLDKFFFTDATTITRYPLLVANQWYSPVVVNEPGQGKQILGELYKVDQSTMDWMDDLEGITLPNGYRRHQTEVQCKSGEPLLAWIYTKTRDLIQQVHTGPLSDYQDQRYIPRSARP